jgi:uncharacterized protein involved in exopolysaccharide biosynthesis
MPQSPSPELSDYLSALKRRRALLLGVSLPVLALSLALALGLPDVFVSTGLITYTNATIPGELPTQGPPRDKAYIDLYILGLTGAVLNPAVLKQLVQEMPELVKAGQTREDAILDIIDRTHVRPVTAPILDPDSGRRRDVISAFAISFDSREPVEAQRVSAWLTRAFIGGNRVGLQMRAQAARQFYVMAAERYGKHINELQSQLAEFKARHFNELPDVTKLNLGLVDRTQKDLDDVTRQLRASQQERIFLQADLARAQLTGLDEGVLGELQTEYNSKTTRYDANHPDMLGLRRQIDALRASGQSLDTLSVPAQLQMQKSLLALVRQRYSEDHPDVQRIERQIASLNARFGKDASNTERREEAPSGDPVTVRLTSQLNALDTHTAELERRESQLREQLDSLEKRLDESPLLEHEYKTLTDSLQAANAKYDELSKNTMSLEMTSAAIASGRSDELRVVQAPDRPETAAKPRRLLILGAGLALATVLGFTTVVVREGFDQKVRCSRDVHRLLNVWPLVAVPELPNAQRTRHRRLRVGIIAAGTLMTSVAAIVTGRIFYN